MPRVQLLFFEDIAPGVYKNGLRCENLEQLTFADRSFDVFITQDVMKHVFDRGSDCLRGAFLPIRCWRHHRVSRTGHR